MCIILLDTFMRKINWNNQLFQSMTIVIFFVIIDDIRNFSIATNIKTAIVT